MAIRLWSVLVMVQALVTVAQGVSIDFAENNYVVSLGSRVALVTSLSETITGGLEGYALKMNFPSGTLSLSETDITVPGALNYSLFDFGAQREVGSGFASVAGFVANGANGYYGTDFVVFYVTIPMDAPLGVHTVSLEPLLPDGDNFVDGFLNVLDDSMGFGSMTLEIVDNRPEETFDDFKVEVVNGQAKLSFTALTGWLYTIQVSSNSLTGWQTLAHVTPPSDGTFEYLDTTNPLQSSLFYRVLPGVH